MAWHVLLAASLAAAALVWIGASFLIASPPALPALIAGLAVPAACLPWMAMQTAESRLELMKARDAMENLAKTDMTTRLLNRVGFLEKARTLFAQARGEGSPVTAILVDVDHLVAINEQYGRSGGDAVLAHIADFLKMNIQPGVDLAARYGGAEFVLLLPQADHAWALAFAERLRGAVANRPIQHDGRHIAVSASFGVAALRDGDTDVEVLIRRAAQALRLAKDSGRNKIEVDGHPAALAA